jgi:hypothetical protein
MKQTVRTFLTSLGILTVASLASVVRAAPTSEELCEKLHADYLLKARRALSEDKRDEALRLLVEAQTVAKTCAESSEKPLPQKHARESSHASAPARVS